MTREQLQSRLDAYLSAELRALEAQQYTVGEGATARQKRMAELDSIRTGITECRRELAAFDAAAGGQSRVYYARPLA